ncbi:MAG: FecR domain-containing protein [Bacteroidota bacterium]
MDISPDLLKKYLNNQCTPEERKQVEAHLASEKNAPSDLPDELAQKMKAHFWKNISPAIREKPARVVPLYQRVMRYAAAVVILFAVGFFTYNYFVEPVQHGNDLAFFEDYTSIQTQRGQKRTVKLSDGSTIRMNYETEIKVPEKFEGEARVVFLSGHAHFNVARDTEHPFIIYTEDTRTEVLGTAFDINTKEEGGTEIIVTSGKVAFSEKGKEENQVTLTLNERAVLGTGKEIKTDKVYALALTAWKDNRLVLKDKTLKEIISVLEPWFDVQVTVRNQQLLDERFNLSLDNPPLTGALERLAFMGSFDYQIEGKKVIIR